MLQVMRTGAQSIVVKVILFGLLLLAMGGLALTGLHNNFTGGGQDNAVARVGGDKISLAEFDRQVRLVMEQKKLTRNDAYQQGVPQGVLRDQVDIRMYDRAAHDAGLLMGRAEAAEQIRKSILPQIVAQGIPEKDAFNLILRQLGMSEGEFVQSVKARMAADVLVRSVVGGAYAPKQLIEDAMKYRYETRRANYFTLTAADAGSIAPPTDDEIQKQYVQTQERYMRPETRTLSALVIDQDVLGIKSGVTADDVRKYYDDNIAQYTSPEEREITQIVAKDEDTAKKVYAAAISAGDMKKALASVGAQDASLVTSTYRQNEMPEELAEAAFKAEVRKPVAPVKSPLGWHVMYVTKIVTLGKVRKFEDVSADIRKQLAADKGSAELYDRINAIDDMAAGGKSVDDIAAELNAKPVVLQNVGRDGKSGGEIPAAAKNLPAYDKVVAAAFGLKEGEVSNLIEGPNATFVLVSPTSVSPSVAAPLKDVRADVVKDWYRQKRAALLDEKAAKVTEQVKLGESFDKIAASFGKTPLRTGFMTRRAKDAPLAGMLPVLFSIDNAGGVMTVRGDDSLSFVQLADRKVDVPANPPKEEVDQMTEALRDAVQTDLLEQYRRGLMKEYNVTLNEDLLEKQYGPQAEEDE
jgi:peptidyl-prolyl cis-trans isomerase D